MQTACVLSCTHNAQSGQSDHAVCLLMGHRMPPLLMSMRMEQSAAAAMCNAVIGSGLQPSLSHSCSAIANQAWLQAAEAAAACGLLQSLVCDSEQVRPEGQRGKGLKLRRQAEEHHRIGVSQRHKGGTGFACSAANIMHRQKSSVL